MRERVAGRASVTSARMEFQHRKPHVHPTSPVTIALLSGADRISFDGADDIPVKFLRLTLRGRPGTYCVFKMQSWRTHLLDPHRVLEVLDSAFLEARNSGEGRSRAGGEVWQVHVRRHGGRQSPRFAASRSKICVDQGLRIKLVTPCRTKNSPPTSCTANNGVVQFVL